MERWEVNKSTNQIASFFEVCRDWYTFYHIGWRNCVRGEEKRALLAEERSHSLLLHPLFAYKGAPEHPNDSIPKN